MEMDMTALTNMVAIATVCSVLVVVGGGLVAVLLVRRQNQKNPPRDLDQDE